MRLYPGSIANFYREHIVGFNVEFGFVPYCP